MIESNYKLDPIIVEDKTWIPIQWDKLMFPFNEIKTDRKLKRNDVVTPRSRLENGGYMMGRVWRRLDSEHVVVIDTGRNVTVYRDEELVLVDYKGVLVPVRQPFGFRSTTAARYDRMPNLRKLKRKASDYNAHFGGRSRRYDTRWTEEERKEALASLGRDDDGDE